MAREINNDFINQVNADVLTPCIFIKLQFTNGDVNVWTGYGDMVFNGDFYIGVGDLLKIDPIVETQELKSSSVAFTFTNLNSALTASSLTENYQGRPAFMWFAVLSQSRQIISTPYQLFKGHIDVILFNDLGDNSDFIVQCESNIINLRKTRERRYTDEDQKINFIDDKGLEFVAKIQDIEINWG